MVRTGAVAIETYAEGDGPTLLILPSCGRDGGADHKDVTTRAVRAGWRLLRPQPRGVADSSGPMKGVTLHDLADVAAAVIRGPRAEAVPSCSATPSGMPCHAWWRPIIRTWSLR